MTREPFGANGDFATASENSHMISEPIGQWATEGWTSVGRPNPVPLIGRGPDHTALTIDALSAVRIAPEFRAALIIPEFYAAPDVTLIDTSPARSDPPRRTQ
jgi:SAM-dependent MidA family methyltransferase